MSKITAVSAPGKVLIAGGYLVLDPAYSGTVISSSSRFYTVIQPKEGTGIRVRSPQFKDATWSYAVEYEPLIAVDVAADNNSKNKFVHLALQNTIVLASEIKGNASVELTLSKGIDITIVGDNDFYSQRATLESLSLPRTLDSLEKIPPFAITGVSLSQVHKTGMGSSAALITSLVSALLLHLGAISPDALSDVSHPDRQLAHNLAQFVHCLAQGKIGSGFDVSAAVFGSHLYTRFDPAVLSTLMNEDVKHPVPRLPILSPSNETWNYRVTPFKLPPLTRMMLADVDAGSDTPSLVGKVLKWRKEDGEKADILWSTLDRLNVNLAQTLLELSELYTKDTPSYTAAVQYLSVLQSEKWLDNHNTSVNEAAVTIAFHKAHTLSQSIREKMREMGTLAGVPIEPPEQTKLLDSCISQAGVIGGGVPGAGGYDAIWLLVFVPPQVISETQPLACVQNVWCNYKDLDVSPLAATESTAPGIRLESVSEVEGLQHATMVGL